jgi:hypothetical protein
MTYFKYGSHQHPNNEVNMTSMQILPRHGRRNMRHTRVFRMQLVGEILADNQTDFNTKISELINAYKDDDQDAGLYYDDGTATRHILRTAAADSVSGVRVVHRSWPKGDPAELATLRTFSIILEQEVIDRESEIVAFMETLRFFGNGGPRWQLIEEVTLRPFRQDNLNRFTVQRIVQRGQAIGLQGWIQPPSPIFPNWEHGELRDWEFTSPEHFRHMYLYYPSSWSYSFSLPAPTGGFPNVAP